MKTIGLLGGMSWESTVSYYQTVNRVVAERLGGFHSAQVLLYSVDFHSIEELQRQDCWREAGQQLAQAARILESGGADFLLLCTNTMHKVAAQVEAAVSIPLLHIADATAERIAAAGVASVGLLGTRFTMEQSFYRDRLERHGLKVVVPSEPDRACVHRIIYEELCHGIVSDDSRAEYRLVVDALIAQGCEGILLGCTEIGLLVGPRDASVPIFDTAEIHATRAALCALGEAELT